MQTPTGRTWISALSIAGLVVAASACGDDDNAIEDLIERQAAESGEDVQVDIDDGNIRVETEEGEFSLNVDDDGSFTIEGEDGEVITGQGGGDDDSFVIESGDGEDGITIEGGPSADIPDDWPDDVPTPDGFDIENSSSFTTGGAVSINVGGRSDDGPGWVEQYGATLEGAGFAEQSRFTQNDDTFVTYVRDDMVVNVQTLLDNGSWIVSVAVSPTP